MNRAMLRTASLRSAIPDVVSNGGGGGKGLCSSPSSPRISLSVEPSCRHDDGFRRMMSENDVIAASRRIGGDVSRSFSSGGIQKGKEDRLVIPRVTFDMVEFEFSQIGVLDGVASEVNGYPGRGCGNGSKDGSGHGTGTGSSSNGGRKLGEYYEKMLRMNPGDPLLLRNYARYLHEVEGNVQRAEEYYGRATLADPEDGEVLSMYAKLIWEVQGDGGRAKRYHERAVSATPDNCAVLGSYAQFLWESNDDEEDMEKKGELGTYV